MPGHLADAPGGGERHQGEHVAVVEQEIGEKEWLKNDPDYSSDLRDEVSASSPGAGVRRLPPAAEASGSLSDHGWSATRIGAHDVIGHFIVEDRERRVPRAPVPSLRERRGPSPGASRWGARDGSRLPRYGRETESGDLAGIAVEETDREEHRAHHFVGVLLQHREWRHIGSRRGASATS